MLPRLLCAAVLLASAAACSAAAAAGAERYSFSYKHFNNKGALPKTTGPPRKQLAGPPSEFAQMALPQPLSAALSQDSAAADIKFAEEVVNRTAAMDSKKFDAAVPFPRFSYQSTIVVDSATAWMFSVFVPVPAGATLTVELKDPAGKPVDLAAHAHPGHFPIGEIMIPETTYTFDKDIAQGQYALSVKLQTSAATPRAEVERLRAAPAPGYGHGQTVVWNQSPIIMHSHLNTYQLVTDRDVGLVARLTDKASLVDGVAPQAIKAITVEAKIDVTMPDGQERVVTMHDDGLHGDGEADDGIFAGSFMASEVGNYVMRGILEGVLPDGKTRFRRTTDHLMPVSSLEVQLNGKASGQWSQPSAAGSNEKLELFVGVEPRAVYQRVERKFRAYAQVWGKDAAGADKAIAWVSQMVNIDHHGEALGFTLTLDSGWVSAASAVAPFELRHVVLQDSNNYVPETDLGVVPVTLAAGARDEHFTRLVAARPLTLDNATKEWRVGRNPIPAPGPNAKNGLVMLHGYCSETNPWEHQKSDWTDGYFFLNPKASIGNDAFALMVVDFVETNGLSSFGLIGHSQGGLVSAHLMNYYFTGLDHTTAGAKVQSVGSPYQGCSAAGSIANLGTVFGVGCGENLDLSRDAAGLWGAGISAEVKKDVYFYTTTYVAGKLFGDWCSLPMNAILQWPNDGTSELPFTAFSGANNMGNVEKQCHTTEMGYPPQYWNQARNSVLNKNAAR